MSNAARATLPVTVVGGFLGAGKTTFLNHLLAGGDARYAVLVNDFGAVNIDAGLIAQHDGATMTLTNGCVCCSTGGGFVETLGKVLDAATSFDHVIIEASGVGDPWRIAEIALVEPSLRLNAVIVVADATRIEAQLADRRIGETVRSQFDRSDLVLLNKIDLLDRAAACGASAAVDAARSGMRIVETTRQTFPDLPICDSGTVSRFRAIEAFDRADHEGLFQRWTYARDGSFDRAQLQVALAQLPPQLLRLKGHCRLSDEGRPALLQMVGQDWTLTDMHQLAAQEDILLVGVGTNDLPATTNLDAILDTALAGPAPISLVDGHRPSAKQSYLPRQGHSSCL